MDSVAYEGELRAKLAGLTGAAALTAPDGTIVGRAMPEALYQFLRKSLEDHVRRPRSPWEENPRTVGGRSLAEIMEYLRTLDGPLP